MKVEIPNSESFEREQELKSLRDKANMLASMHSKLSDEYRWRHRFLSSVLLFLSTLLVGLTFISEEFVERSIGVTPDALKWLVGIISILTFFGILLLSQLELQRRATSHREAVRFYFAIVNKIRQWLDSGIEITEDIIEQARTDYSWTQGLPKIPDSRFLQLKQWHLQKVALSRELDKRPFDSIKSIKRNLSDFIDE